MSNGPNVRFSQQYSDAAPEQSGGAVRRFALQEIIDPKSIGKKKFSYDSETAQNFDETNIKKAREGAKEILADAIDKAKVKAVQIREEARKLGYSEGHKEGFSKGEQDAKREFAPVFEAFQGHLRELTEFRRKMYGKVEREMIELVVGLTRKVIHHELSIREDSIQEMIRLAVESVLDKESMVIKVNPADKGYAESFRAELHQLFDEIKNITFEATPALERGGCMIETNFGVIDARIHHLDEQIGKILGLTPESFEEGQTQFPAPPPGQEGAPAVETAKDSPQSQAKPEAEAEDDLGDDFGDFDNFDFPDFTPQNPKP